MATRDEILRELDLAPQWRRRGPTPPGPAIAIELMPLDARAPHEGSAARNSDPGARAQRIALLDWTNFATDVDACNACGLGNQRRCSVPGVGDRDAEWMFVGEAPGAEEDAKGEPFVGQAGRLLDNMLAALGMSRARHVYIANVLKCRPPGNRTPTPLEAQACRPYLERQLALVQPRLLVALGKSAASLLLGTELAIAALRGRVHSYQGIPLIVTYHPAYLLRTPVDKAKAWEDLVLARRTLASIKAGVSVI